MELLHFIVYELGDGSVERSVNSQPSPKTPNLQSYYFGLEKLNNYIN